MSDTELRISDFDYDLPPDRIAQAPARPRDASRLMVLDRSSGAISHHRFHELPDLLSPGDLVVVNDTRVLPAAFTARRATGSRIEGCFLRVLGGGLWEVLLAGRGRLRPGQALELLDAAGQPDSRLELVDRGAGGTWLVRPPEGADAVSLLDRVGRPPLPPYIHRQATAETDRDDYQTIYARRAGAVAAPTAGLHFTPQVLARLDARGIERVSITLHVGLGTFQPVRVERLTEHAMHEEFVEISAGTAGAINRALAAGRRVVAIGTTTVRALESAATGAVPFSGLSEKGTVPVERQGPSGKKGAVPISQRRETGTAPQRETGTLRPMRGWTRLFIRPPYEFRAVGAIVTNFHLPRTTLLVLVSAFAGRDRLLAAYGEAVRAGYRFYSYGDAMLIM